ncbi:hypothetical protein ES703_110059 [subsurface metagenome]
MCGYSKDVIPKGSKGDEHLYYCQACNHEFLASESGKLLVHTQTVFCPICNNPMRLDGRYYRCIANQLHLCLIKEEWDRYKSGEKDIKWLRWRMKVRLGKMVRGR